MQQYFHQQAARPCPLCGGGVGVTQSVQGIVMSGTGSGTFSARNRGYISHGFLGSEGYSSTSSYTEGTTSYSSDLARMLAPPPEPRDESAWGCFSVTAFLGLILLGVSFVGTIFHPSPDVPIVENTVLGISCSLVCFGIVILLYLSKKKQNQRRTIQFAQQHPLWERQMQRWCNLFHCPHCNVVYLANTGGWAYPSQMYNLL